MPSPVSLERKFANFIMISLSSSIRFKLMIKFTWLCKSVKNYKACAWCARANENLQPNFIVSSCSNEFVGRACYVDGRPPKTSVRGRLFPFVTEIALNVGGCTNAHTPVHVAPANQILHLEFTIGERQVAAEDGRSKCRYYDANDTRHDADKSASYCKRKQIAVTHGACRDKTEPHSICIFSDTFMIALKHEHPVRTENEHKEKRRAEDKRWT